MLRILRSLNNLRFANYKQFQQYCMFSQQVEQERAVDLSVLEDFQINAKDDWVNWQFNYPQMQDLPLSFSNRYNFYKNIKFAPLKAKGQQGKQQDSQFTVIQSKIKIRDKQHISKDINIEKKNQGNPSRKQYSKRQQRLWRPYVNQVKTNFKKITVKNNWEEIKNITKNILQYLPKSTPYTRQHLKTVGKIRQLNKDIERISWTPVRFKENQAYEVKPVNTQDEGLMKIGGYYNQKEDYDRFAVLCCPQFLLTLLTIRGGAYPWNIEIEKMGNLLAISGYKNTNQANQLSYLDLFLANENTNRDMPLDQNKIKEVCINATKLTKIFQDLIASGDIADVQKDPQSKIFSQMLQEDQQQEEKEEQQEQQEQRHKKYLKLKVGLFDIFTYVHADGVKKNQKTGEYDEYLSRIFMQAETQGLWINEMKQPGSIVTKQYQSNGCSLQKWICQARLAEVQKIKLGYMGFDHNKPVLLNVNQVAVQTLQKTLSYSIQFGWSFVNYLLNLIVKQQDGKYVLIKAPYVPQMKLYKLPKKDSDDQQEDQQNKQDQN